MSKYTVNSDFWHDGNFVEFGTELELSDAEAKYIKGNLTLVEEKVEEDKPSAQPATDPAVVNTVSDTDPRIETILPLIDKRSKSTDLGA